MYGKDVDCIFAVDGFMNKKQTRTAWLEPIVRRVESRFPSDSENVRAMRDSLEWCRERDAEDAVRYPVKPPVVTIDPSLTPVHRKDVAYREGELVTHMKRPDWGVGTVMGDSTKESVRVLFAFGDERTFGLPLIALAKVKA